MKLQIIFFPLILTVFSCIVSMEQSSTQIAYKIKGYGEKNIEQDGIKDCRPVQKDGSLILQAGWIQYRTTDSVFYNNPHKMHQHSGEKQIKELLYSHYPITPKVKELIRCIDNNLKEAVREKKLVLSGALLDVFCERNLNFRFALSPYEDNNNEIQLCAIEANGLINKIFTVNNSQLIARELIDLSSKGTISKVAWYNKNWLLILRYFAQKSYICLLCEQNNQVDIITFNIFPFKILYMNLSPFEKHVIFARVENKKDEYFFIKLNIVTKKYSYISNNNNRFQLMVYTTITACKKSDCIGELVVDCTSDTCTMQGEIHLPLEYMKACLDKNMFKRETFIEDCLREYKKLQ